MYYTCKIYVLTRKLSYRKDGRTLRPIYRCCENFQVPEYTHGYFSRNFNGRLFWSILWMCVQNLKFIALPIPEGVSKQIWAPPGTWICRSSLFSKIFNGLLFGCTLWMYRSNLKIWLVLSSTCHFLTDNSLQSADKDQQEMRAVAEKPHDAIVKFDTYRNVQCHHAVLPAIAWHLVLDYYEFYNTGNI